METGGTLTKEAGVLNRRKGVRSGWLLISVLASVFPLAACLVPVATPTPSVTPTPTSTPASAALPPPVTVDLSGKINSLGFMLETVQVVSSDGRAKLTLPKGAVVLDEEKHPPKSITCTPFQPPESQDGLVVGLAYEWAAGEAAGELGHQGTIMPPATITITYDPPPANPRIDPNNPDMPCWWEAEGMWKERTAIPTVDPANRIITSPMANFIPVVVIFWYTDVKVLPGPAERPARKRPVTVYLEGKIDGQGVLLEAVQVVSSDGRARLTLPKGATVLDAQGQPAESITCTSYQPPESNEGVVVGQAYYFGGVVAGGTINPPATLTITYDPPPADPRTDPSKPDIAVWWPEKNQWVKSPFPVTVDQASRTLTSLQGNFLPLVVIFWYVDTTPPVGTFLSVPPAGQPPPSASGRDVQEQMPQGG